MFFVLVGAGIIYIQEIRSHNITLMVTNYLTLLEGQIEKEMEFSFICRIFKKNLINQK